MFSLSRDHESYLPANPSGLRFVYPYTPNPKTQKVHQSPLYREVFGAKRLRGGQTVRLGLRNQGMVKKKAEAVGNKKKDRSLVKKAEPDEVTVFEAGNKPVDGSTLAEWIDALDEMDAEKTQEAGNNTTPLKVEAGGNSTPMERASKHGSENKGTVWAKRVARGHHCRSNIPRRQRSENKAILPAAPVAVMHQPTLERTSELGSQVVYGKQNPKRLSHEQEQGTRNGGEKEHRETKKARMEYQEMFVECLNFDNSERSNWKLV
ncbi:hypothetical protein DFH27DRAFT_553188 [Peziza echinospora]|nr:hypothetical protein DFH27DRAFT_553188 [Peziza echinospora]